VQNHQNEKAERQGRVGEVEARPRANRYEISDGAVGQSVDQIAERPAEHPASSHWSCPARCRAVRRDQADQRDHSDKYHRQSEPSALKQAERHSAVSDKLQPNDPIDEPVIFTVAEFAESKPLGPQIESHHHRADRRYPSCRASAM
jgi:hypothetical protein